MSSKIGMILRILFALSLIVFGLNKFLFFIPTPPMEGTAGELMNIYVESGFMKMIGGLEIISGISLLVKKFIPLSLTIMVAIIFNAVVFHILHDPAGLGPAVGALILSLTLVYFHKSRFTSLLSA
ncbi:MAG: hypothetical protein AB8H03_19175 [Saprospiraceae bacterium]